MPHKVGSGRKQGRRTRQAQQQRASAPAPAAARPMRGDPGELLLHLQRTVGNQAVNALLRQQRAAGNWDMPATALAGRPYTGEAAPPLGARLGAVQLAATQSPAVAWSSPLQRDADSALALAAGPVVARQFDPAAGHGDDHLNPESIVHDLRRFIDQEQATIDDKPPPDHAFSMGMRFVRKVDAAGVIRVLDNLTAAQVATVKRLYAEQEGRPLEKDLFEGGESGIPSSLTADQRARIKALLQGTRAEGEGPGGPTDARLEADAVELHELLQGDLDEPKRERIMALHRRPVTEITGLDNAYARLYGHELSVVLGDRLSGLQRNRMAELRDGNWALADACAIEDKRRALDELAARPIDPFHPEAREKERARLVAGIEGIVAMNSQEALNDPANAGKPAAQAVRERIAAILSTPAGDPKQSLGDALATTLGPDAGGAIAAMARGGSVVEVAARRLLEMEANHTTRTEKIVELLHELRTQAGHDVLARVQDPSLSAQEKEQIAAHPEAAVDALARQYAASFRDTYNSLRGEGRSYEAILESAHSYDEDMLRALTEGGGQMAPVVELDHAIRKGDVEAIKAVLQRQRTKSAIDDLVGQYEAMPGHGQGSLRRALFGLFGAGNADLAMAMDSHTLGHGLLTGRDALLAEEALRKPARLGGADEVDWLASYGRREAAVAEANSGIVGSLREIGGDPETQALMNESAARLRALQAEWTQHDPWGRPRQEILAEMRRWRATLTGDATAYEEENTRLVAEIRSAVSFAVQVALAVALPGIGGGFLATTALNIGATVASNMVIYGDQYSLESFRNDVLGGVLGAAGGKLGEELAAGAVAGKAASSAEAAEAIASRVAGDAAAPAAEAAERAGVSTGLLRQGEEASALAARGSVALAAARQGGNLIGSTAGTTIATGQNGFTLEGLAKGAFLGLLGKFAESHAAAAEHEGVPDTGASASQEPMQAGEREAGQPDPREGEAAVGRGGSVTEVEGGQVRTGESGERTIEFVNALGESHEITLTPDGRLIRCSQFCTEIGNSLLIRAQELRGGTGFTPEIATRVADLHNRAQDLSAEARKLAALPKADQAAGEVQLLQNARTLENDMARVEQELRSLTETDPGLRQEEQIRNRQELAGREQPYGADDQAVARQLHTGAFDPNWKPGKTPKSADFVLRDKGSGRWIVGESKGGDPHKAIQQLDVTVQALLAKEPTAVANLELRLYMNPQQYERLITQPESIQGFVLRDGYLGFYDFENANGAFRFVEVQGQRVRVLQEGGFE